MASAPEEAQLLDALLTIVERLVVTHHVSQERIQNSITDKLEKLSLHLPKVQVLYNTCYGGYGLHPKFEEFLRTRGAPLADRDDNNEERTAAALVMPDFGRQVAAEHPQIFAAIMHHQRYAMDTVVTNGVAVEDLNQQVKQLRQILRKTLLAPNHQFPEISLRNVPESWLYIKSKGFKCLNYNRQDLLDEIRIQLDIQSDLIAEKGTQLGIFRVLPSSCMKEMLNQPNVYDRELSGELSGKSFADAIASYGPHCREVWEYKQTHVHSTAMRYLLKKLKAADGKDGQKDIFTNEPLYLTEQETAHCYRTMGLLFAGSGYAQLHIGEAPAFVTWRVGDYNGKESIVW